MQPDLWRELNERYDDMRSSMELLVTQAKEAHGRLGPYKQGREIVVAG